MCAIATGSLSWRWSQSAQCNTPALNILFCLTVHDGRPLRLAHCLGGEARVLSATHRHWTHFAACLSMLSAHGDWLTVLEARSKCSVQHTGAEHTFLSDCVWCGPTQTGSLSWRCLHVEGQHTLCGAHSSAWVTVSCGKLISVWHESEALLELWYCLFELEA